MVQPIGLQITLIGTRKTSLGSQTLTYTVKRSSKAKHVRLEVSAKTGLTVVIPESYKLNELPDLLKKKRRWILGKLAKYGHIHQLSAEKELKTGDTIPYLGRDLRVLMLQSCMNADNVRLVHNRLVVSLGSATSRLNLALEWWYRRQAEKLIKERAGELCARLGVTYGRLSIAEPRTHWGSCSRKGNLNFNWKLMMVPKPVIDYVIIHELAHLKEMNHSRRFWQVVAQYCPGWRQHRKWLKDHEAELTAKLSTC